MVTPEEAYEVAPDGPIVCFDGTGLEKTFGILIDASANTNPDITVPLGAGLGVVGSMGPGPQGVETQPAGQAQQQSDGPIVCFDGTAFEKPFGVVDETSANTNPTIDQPTVVSDAVQASADRLIAVDQVLATYG
jgi:hypothetical protein